MPTPCAARETETWNRASLYAISLLLVYQGLWQTAGHPPSQEYAGTAAEPIHALIEAPPPPREAQLRHGQLSRPSRRAAPNSNEDRLAEIGHHLLDPDDLRTRPLRSPETPTPEALDEVRGQALLRLRSQVAAAVRSELHGDEGNRIDWFALLRGWPHGSLGRRFRAQRRWLDLLPRSLGTRAPAHAQVPGAEASRGGSGGCGPPVVGCPFTSRPGSDTLRMEQDTRGGNAFLQGGATSAVWRESNAARWERRCP